MASSTERISANVTPKIRTGGTPRVPGASRACDDCVDAARRAELGQHALPAARVPGNADPAAMPDEQVREPGPVGAGDDSHQTAFDLHGVVVPGEPEPL